MHVYIIDNYDSFTFNLYQYIGEIFEEKQLEKFKVTVKRNDEVTLEEVKAANPDRIIISPGPGTPEDESYFGVCADVIRELGPTIPLLGVCLGMQGITYVFGGRIVKASVPMHGKTSAIHHTNDDVFKGIPQKLEIMRYHSLIAERASFPDSLEIISTVPEKDFEGDYRESGEIMGVKHKEFPIFGIQFHPESFATEGGKDILSNFLFLK